MKSVGPKKVKESTTTTEILVVLDKSGSMHSRAGDAIGGFNSFLKQQKEAKDKRNLTLVLFDTTYSELYSSVDAKYVAELSYSTYVPGGGTALYDTLGRALNRLEDRGAKKALVVIITDGEENSSKEFGRDTIRTKISRLKEDRNWEFIFLGADQDAFTQGEKIGIQQQYSANIRSFGATGQTMSNAAEAFISCNMSGYNAQMDSLLNEKKEKTS